MAQGDGTTAGVQLLAGNAKLINGVSGLGSESLVDFEDINLVHLGAGLLEGLGDGESWADTHNSGGNTSDGEGENAAKDLAAELLSDVATGEENAGGTVRDLTGVTGGG